jgi:hypothetical protein
MEESSSPEHSGRVVTKEEQLFPKFDYYIDESDPDVVVLRRQGGSFVAAFSARGGHEGGHRGGRQGGLREVDRGEGGVLGPSRRRRPNEEHLGWLEAKLRA